MDHDSIAVLLLAAGSSSRLGRPKQLVMYQGETMIMRAVRMAKEAELYNLHIVTGANQDQIVRQLEGQSYTEIYNEDWSRGMGNSLAKGVQYIIAEKKYSQLMVLLTDQVHVDVALLKSLLAVYKSSASPIILSRYDEGQGPPSLFSHEVFEELALLDGDEGARSIIKKYSDQIAYIEFLKGHRDIDTEDDLKYIENL